jgi:hypothetical protein
MTKNESGSMSPIDDDDDGSQAEEGDVGGGSFESGKWFGNTVSGSVAPATMLEQVSTNSGCSSDPQIWLIISAAISFSMSILAMMQSCEIPDNTISLA